MLAFACAFTMFAGAAFTDQADINDVNAEAVNTLVALGVIDGYEDGSFRPDDTVTRAEMAKMIYTIRTGRSDASAYNDDATSFTDITSHWARGYIKYCQSMGIIAGKSVTSFDPDNTVTTQEAAKMLLVTLGYNAETAGLEGAGWGTKTNALADENGLLTDVFNGTTQGLPRQYAAQIIYNAINAHTVVYRDGAYTNWSANGTEQLPTVGERYMGLIRTTATIVADSKSDSALKDGQLRIQVDGETGKRVITYTVSNIEDLIGMSVDVLWKESNDRDGLDKDDTIYGLYEDGSTETVTATSDDVEESGTASDGVIKINGTKYDVASVSSATDVVIYNQGGYTADSASTTDAAEAAFVALDKQNGDTIKFILNESGEVTKAYVTKTELGTVTAVNSTKVTISGLGALTIADHNVYEGIAKDDVVTYTRYYNTDADEGYVVVEEAEKVSGTLDGYKNDGGKTESVTLDGTVYKVYNKDTMVTPVAGETGKTAMSTGDIGEDFDLYLVNGYVRAAVQVSESASNYSLIVDKSGNTTEAGSKWDPLQLVVLNAAGEETTITVDEDSDLKKATDYHIGDIVTYTGDAAEALVTVEAAFTTDSSSNAAYTKVDAGKTVYNDTSKTVNGVVTSSDCVLFVTTDGTTAADNLTSDREFKAYNIRSLKDVVAGANAVHTIKVLDDSRVVAVFALLGKAPGGATDDVVYGIVSESNGTFEIDNTEYSRYTVASNDDNYIVNLKTGSLTMGDIVAFAPSADEEYTVSDFTVLSSDDAYTDEEKSIDGSTYTVSTVAIKNQPEDDLLTYYTSTTGDDDSYTGENETTKAVADDVVVTYVDVDNDAAGEEIGITGFDTVTGYLNAIIVVDGDGVICSIIIETSGEDNIFA